jgi:hypothetical protein
MKRYHALDAFIIGGYSVNGPFGSTFHRLRATPRLGFLALMQRATPTEWRTTVKLPRPGNWRLIVPNWCAPGVASPLPADRTVTVRYGSSSAFPTGWAAGGSFGGVLLAGLVLAAGYRSRLGPGAGRAAPATRPAKLRRSKKDTPRCSLREALQG